MPWALAWPFLAFLANFVGSYFLHRNQDLKEVFGAKEQEWLVTAVLLVGQNLVPFLLICSLVFSSQIKDKFKNNLLLNVFLTYLCLSVPALFSHVLQYGGFHIEIEDIEQHNSRSIHKLLTACSYAISSFCLSQTLCLPFEAGFFSACLAYAMQVSLTILDKNGNSQPVYVSCTFFSCFIFNMVRKYLEKDEGIDRTMQMDNQIPIDTNTDPSPGSPSNTIELQENHNRVTEPLNVYTNRNPSEPTTRDLTLKVSIGKYGSDERDVRQESRDDDEHHGEISPPRLYMNTSSSSGDTTDEEEDVPSISKCVVKEGKDIIMTHLKVRKPFDEGTSASDDHFDKIEESEVPSQEIGHEEQDMRSSTSSDHMEIASSSWFGGYEKDDVPLLLPKSDNIIDGETQIVSIGLGQMERSIDQSQESGSQGYEKDDNPPLLPKSNLKVDKDNTHLGTSNPSDDDNNSDHESSNDEGSDDDGFHGGTGCNFGVGRRGKDPGQESDHQEQENTRPLRADISEIVSGSNLREGDVPLLLSESKNMEVDRGQMEGIVDPRDGINYEEHGEMSAPCGDMKIRRSEKFVNGFRNSKKFVSASRNSKKFVSRSRISKKISVIFLNKLVHYRDALKYVLLSFVVFITTLGFLIYQDSRRAAPFVPLGILTGIVCLLAALSASVFTDKTRSALNDNTDSKNGELSHTDSDLDAWLVDEEHNRVHCRHCIDELLLKQ